jgi:hypothetical protein
VKRIELPLGAEGHMPPKDEPQLTAAERSALASFVRNQSSSESSSRAVASNGPRDTTPAAEPPPATTAGGEPPAETATAPSTPNDATPATPAATRTEEDDAPPDPELVARLPSRVDLYASGVSALLAERCAKCHAGKFPAGNLSVVDHQALARGGNSGPAVVFGDLAKSTLWQRVSLPPSDGDHMPPEEEPQLGADDLALLRAFILTGSADGATVATAELSAGAVRAVAARSPGPSALPATARRTGGCGACTVGERPESSVLARSGLLFVLLSAAFRRRSRRRLT